MRGVLAAAITELLELETASGRLLILRRRVVALFALPALQCNNFPHFLILPDFGSRGLNPFASASVWNRDQELKPLISAACVSPANGTLQGLNPIFGAPFGTAEAEA
jgi:hypothetical protein